MQLHINKLLLSILLVMVLCLLAVQTVWAGYRYPSFAVTPIPAD